MHHSTPDGGDGVIHDGSRVIRDYDDGQHRDCSGHITGISVLRHAGRLMFDFESSMIRGGKPRRFVRCGSR